MNNAPGKRNGEIELRAFTPFHAAVLFTDLTEIADPEPHEGALNMAIDEILLRSADRPLLRVYRWSEPTVTFGYFGKIVEVRSRWPGMKLIRRWTGGGEVDHRSDLTYTLVIPRSHEFLRLSPIDSYRVIHEAIAQLLAEEHRSVSLSAGAATRSAACFQSPSAHDVVAGESKIAGAAQRRTREGLLHQGSIQCDSVERFRGRLATLFGSDIRQRPLTAEELRQAADLAQAKYASAEWLQRF